MNSQRIIGIVLLAAGLALFFIGMNASDSLADRLSNFFTGQFTDTTIWYLVGGAVAAALGSVLMMSGRRIF